MYAAFLLEEILRDSFGIVDLDPYKFKNDFELFPQKCFPSMLRKNRPLNDLGIERLLSVYEKALQNEYEKEKDCVIAECVIQFIAKYFQQDIQYMAFDKADMELDLRTKKQESLLHILEIIFDAFREKEEADEEDVSALLGAFIRKDVQKYPHKQLEIQMIDNIWNYYQNLELEKNADDDGYITGEAKLQELYVFPKIKGDKTWTLTSDRPLRYLIEAPNGYGKTALMKSVLLSTTYSMKPDLPDSEKEKYQKLAELHKIEISYFPIHLEAKDFDQIEHASLMEIICQMVQNEIGEVEEETLRYLIESYNKEGKLLLLLDAFDEVEAGKRKAYVNKLNAFLKSAEGDQASVILTTRPMGQIKGLEGFTKWKIEPLNIDEDEELIMKLIENYAAKSFHQISSEKACQKIKENVYLKGLVVSPYLIMWSVLYMGEDKTPDEIIGNVVNSLVMRQKIEYKDIRQDAKALLEWISYQMLCEEETTFAIERNKNQLTEIFTEALEEIRTLRQFKGAFRHYEDMNDILNIVNVKVGIMIPVGTKLEFQAKELFAKYLTAWWIERIAYEYGLARTIEVLQEIPFTYRYEVIEILMSIMFSHCNKTGIVGPTEMVEISEMLLDHMLLQYVKTFDPEEREKIKTIFSNILNGYFGENDISRNNETYQKIIRRVLMS